MMTLLVGGLMACAAHGAVTTHLSLDCLEGTRQIGDGGIDLFYDAGWYSGGSLVRLLADGEEIASGESGVFRWQPSGVGIPLLEMVVLGTAGAEVGRASLNVSYGQGICGVKVHSGWPWKEVLIEYSILGVMPEDRYIKIVATDNESGKTYECKTFEGVGYTPGTHVVKWDTSADGAKFSSSNVVFTVTTVNGVQLWKGGPYWAERNVGATKPEECGYYFWWGDTVGYKRNSSNNGWVSVEDSSAFSFSSSNCPTYGKDNSQLQSEGYIDETGNLVAAHDAATAHLGAQWRMPTNVEMDALIDNCTTTWTNRNGVAGRLVTGKGAYASRSIFFPAAGYGDAARLYNAGSYGYYWASTPDSDYSNDAWRLYFSSGDFGRDDSGRYYGRSVRPVRGFEGALEFEQADPVWEASSRVVSVDTTFEDGEQTTGCGEVRLTAFPEAVLTTENGTIKDGCWKPAYVGTSSVELSYGGHTLDAEFSVLSYVQNVTARQIWPHKKVEISYVVAEGIDEVFDADAKLAVSCIIEEPTTESPTISNTSNYRWTQSGTQWTSGGKGVQNLSTSYITASVSDATKVSFRWKVSSESGYDKLRFYVDGSEVVDAISGTTDWATIDYALTAGDHTLKWSYTKDGSEDRGSDCGWVDSIQISRTQIKPAERIARTLIGDTSATPGFHRVVWDMEADGFEIAELTSFIIGYGDDPASALVGSVGSGISDPLVVVSADEVESGLWVLDDWVLGYIGEARGRLEVPDGIKGIASGAFRDQYFLEEVVMPDSVIEIGSQAFAGCTDMHSISLGSGLERVGAAAFKDCISLESVEFPEGLVSLGAEAFSVSSGSMRLKSVSLPASLREVGDNAFLGCSMLTGVTAPADLMTCSQLFPSSYQKIESFVVPSGAASVMEGMFRDCELLTSIVLPDTLTGIGNYAFAGCKSLRELGLPDGVESLGVGAFAGCMNLMSVSLPKGLQALEERTFENCPMLDSLVVPANVRRIGANVYSGGTYYSLEGDLEGLSYSAERDETRLGVAGHWYEYRNVSSLTAVYYLGNAPEAQSGTYAGTPEALTSYVIQGSTGWYREGSPTLPTSGWPSSGNVRAITYWQPNVFDVVFDANGGTPASTAVSQITDTTYSLPKMPPTREGYLFNGWWTERAAGAQVTANSRVTAKATHTLYAHWRSRSDVIIVNFNPNGGTVEPMEVVYPTNVTFGTLPVPTRTGYAFAGWYTSLVGGPAVSESTSVIRENNKLYARWTPVRYGIAYVLDGGTNAPGNPSEYTIEDALTLAAPTRTGYVFVGWSPSETIALGTTGELTFTAVWKEDSVADPVIVPADGSVFKTETCEVTITCATEGATIYCSTNGRTPRQSETYRYKGAFEIAETTTIIAFAAKGDMQSEIVEATITKVEAEPLTLENALDEPKLVAVVTSGAAEWVPIDDATAKVGGSVVRSGAIGMEERTCLEAKVYGKGTLTFWWKVSCEDDPRGRYTYDHVVFTADGIDTFKMDGETDWAQRTVDFTTDGEHTIRWTYVTDDWEEPGFEDCAWVDGVNWTGDGPSHGPMCWDEVTDLAAIDDLPDEVKDADVGKFVTWAKTQGIVYSTEGFKSITLEAFLLNCAPADVAERKRLFRFNEIVPGKVPSIRGDFNGTVKILGATTLEAGGDWAENKANARFFKGMLVK